MFRSKGFHGDGEKDPGRTVYIGEYVMIQLDHIALELCNQGRYVGQLARLIGQHHRNRKDTVPQDQAILDHSGHGQHIHIAAA